MARRATSNQLALADRIGISVPLDAKSHEVAHLVDDANIEVVATLIRATGIGEGCIVEDDSEACVIRKLDRRTTTLVLLKSRRSKEVNTLQYRKDNTAERQLHFTLLYKPPATHVHQLLPLPEKRAGEKPSSYKKRRAAFRAFADTQIPAEGRFKHQYGEFWLKTEVARCLELFQSL